MGGFAVDSYNIVPEEEKFVQNTKRVACLSWCTASGKCKPLVIKYEDDENRIRELKIDEVILTEEKNYAGVPFVVYRCAIHNAGLRTELRLVYFKDEARWEIQFQ